MRVHPARPSNPLTATAIDSRGERSAACSAAQRPAPPAPRIRMSVSRLSIVKSAVIERRIRGARVAASRQDYSVWRTRAQITSATSRYRPLTLTPPAPGAREWTRLYFPLDSRCRERSGVRVRLLFAPVSRNGAPTRHLQELAPGPAVPDPGPSWPLLRSPAPCGPSLTARQPAGP